MNTTTELTGIASRNLYMWDAFGERVTVTAGDEVTVTQERDGWAIRPAAGVRSELYTFAQIAARVDIP